MGNTHPKTVHISELMHASGVKFGTSGARGLVTNMNDRTCYIYALAFLQYLLETNRIDKGDQVAIAGDLRSSTPQIMGAIAKAIKDAGCHTIHCGFIPTPAVACYAIQRNMTCMMVTGSHIPDDRNGIKFYKPNGEILKADEQAICSQKVTLTTDQFHAPLPFLQKDAQREYIERFLNFFPKNCLQGLKIGIYEHSTVARDIFYEIVTGLGAHVTPLGRSEHFIPVDTEAIRPEDVMLARNWAVEHGLDTIISADGDGDRPLISDENGQWLRGDIAGVLCARYLGAKHIVTPVSCNSVVEKSDWFNQIDRTRIGSPFVIEGMNKAVSEGAESVMGYEANGGFLTASQVARGIHILPALPTRDAMIVPLAIMMLAKSCNTSISGLVKTMPQRFTSSGRLQNFPAEISQKKLNLLTAGSELQNKQAAETSFAEKFGEIESLDHTDGVRMIFTSGEIVHLRPSGNAPELRCYNEANSEQRAVTMNEICLSILDCWRQ
ncbi:MAG: phosphomannomutase [Mariprofundaceae bacterium]